MPAGLTCDVLVVSGHFAGTEFYSSKPDVRETLPIDALERASCSGYLPRALLATEGGLPLRLRHAESGSRPPATPELAMSLVREGPPRRRERMARALAARHGDSAFEHMRRLFPGVPVIYGFTSKAPYGRVAGPMLDRHLAATASLSSAPGAVNEGLRRLFAPASLVVTEGQRETDPDAGYRAEVVPLLRYTDVRGREARRHPRDDVAQHGRGAAHAGSRREVPGRDRSIRARGSRIRRRARGDRRGRAAQDALPSASRATPPTPRCACASSRSRATWAGSMPPASARS